MTEETMKPPAQSGCTQRPRLLMAVVFVLAAVATSAPTTQAHRPSVSVHRSQTASASLCLEVDATLRHITSALQSCGGSEGAAPIGASTSNNDSASTTSRRERAHEERSVDSVDLSPIHRLMGVLGCVGSVRKNFPHRQIKANKRRNSRSTAAAAHTGEDHVAGPDQMHSGKGQALRKDELPTMVHGAAVQPQPVYHLSPSITTASFIAPPHESVKPIPSERVNHRVRRAQRMGTGECTFQDILNDVCAGADAGGRLIITLNDHDHRVPTAADTQRIQALSVGIQTLSITGFVDTQPLRWLLDNGNWSSVTDIGLQGLQFRKVSFEIFNVLPSLRDIRISNNDRIEIATDGFTLAAYIQTINVTNSTLRQIPDDIFVGFHSLEILNLEGNLITSVSSDLLDNLTSLISLDLGRNLMTSIDDTMFPKLNNLQFLTLSANNITSLSSCAFRGLTGLKRLDLKQNPLGSLREGLFSSLSALLDLTIAGLRLTNLPNGIFDSLVNLELLDLLDNQLTSLQEGVFHHLSSLAELWLNNNQISVVHPNAFGNLRSLKWLLLNDNSLSTLPSGLLSRCTELELLVLTDNRLASLPNDIFTSTPKLRSFLADRNRLTSLDGALAHAPGLKHLIATDNELTAVNAALPMINNLVLGGNPITKLPDVTTMRNLSILRMAGHRIPRIDLTPMLGLQQLAKLELSASASGTSTATIDVGALAAWTGNSLKTLRIANVDASILIAHETHLPRQQFETLEVGWPGLNHQLISPKSLCSLLVPSANQLGIRNSSYEQIELCPDVQIDNVNLQDNAQLKNITASHSIVQLNVSGSVQLETIDVPKAEVLDVGNTRLKPAPALCNTLGHRILFARAVPESAMDDATIKRCLKNIDLLDLSDNPWLLSPTKLNEVVGDEVALSSGQFRSGIFSILPARTTLPVFQLHRSPVECTVQFETHARFVLRFADSKLGFLETQLAYFFYCECAQGHTLSGGNCVVQKPDIAATVAGSVFGGLIFGLLLVYLTRRYQRLTTRLGEHRQLLLESHDEVLALKKAWEISFEELRLIKRVAAGAFGVVYKAEWDTLMVAVKVLQQGAMALDEACVEEFEKEVEFLQRTRHPHVVRFFGAGTDPSGSPFLVLEFVALGSLKDFLQKGLEEQLHQAFEEEEVTHMGQEAEDNVGMIDVSGEDLTLVTAAATISKRWSQASEADAAITTVWDLKLRLLRDVASGMAFIHSLGQVHRDLKSGNVLVSANLRAKITDFGSIRQCFSRTPATRETAMPSTSHEPMYSQALGMATTADMTMTAGVGTPLYMAPESLSGGSYGAQADVFSFGVLMWEVALERVPDLIEQEKGAGFRGPLLSTLDNLLHQGKRLKFARAEAVDVPDWYVRIYRRCTLLDTKERPTFEQLNKSALRCE